MLPLAMVSRDWLSILKEVYPTAVGAGPVRAPRDDDLVVASPIGLWVRSLSGPIVVACVSIGGVYLTTLTELRTQIQSIREFEARESANQLGIIDKLHAIDEAILRIQSNMRTKEDAQAAMGTIRRELDGLNRGLKDLDERLRRIEATRPYNGYPKMRTDPLNKDE